MRRREFGYFAACCFCMDPKTSDCMCVYKNLKCIDLNISELSSFASFDDMQNNSRIMNS